MSGEVNKETEGGKTSRNKRLKSALGHVGLLAALMVYAAAGGLVFRELEQPAEEARLRALASTVREERAWLLQRLHNLTAGAGADQRVEAALQRYEAALADAVGGGVSVPPPPPGEPPVSRWNLLQAVFFASTVLTTIGYGNIVPVTFWGRVFCILFGLVGIPLTLTVIADMGKLFATAVQLLLARIREGGAELLELGWRWRRRRPADGGAAVADGAGCGRLPAALPGGRRRHLHALGGRVGLPRGLLLLLHHHDDHRLRRPGAPQAQVHAAVHAVHPGGAGADVDHHRAGAAPVRAVVAAAAGALRTAGGRAAQDRRPRHRRHRRQRPLQDAHRHLRAQGVQGRRERCKGACRVGAGDGRGAARSGAAAAPAAGHRHLRVDCLVSAPPSQLPSQPPLTCCRVSTSRHGAQHCSARCCVTSRPSLQLTLAVRTVVLVLSEHKDSSVGLLAGTSYVVTRRVVRVSANIYHILYLQHRYMFTRSHR